MATMTSPQRVDCHADAMRDTRFGVFSAILKTDLRAAVDAADQWASDNAASYNSALPATFRNNASVGQKALLLVIVIVRRHLLGV